MSNPEKPLSELEVARDERCFPIARAVFKELPEGLIADTEGQKALQLKTLSAMLAADLNVAMEVSYVFQLLLGILSGLNRTVQETERVNDDVKYDAIAEEVLKIVADEVDALQLGSVTPEKSAEDFKEVKLKLMKLFQDENLSLMEVKYVMQKVFESFTTFNNAVQSSIENSTKRMETKILGIDSMDELSLKKLNDVLLTPQ